MLSGPSMLHRVWRCYYPPRIHGDRVRKKERRGSPKCQLLPVHFVEAGAFRVRRLRHHSADVRGRRCRQGRAGHRRRRSIRLHPRRGRSRHGIVVVCRRAGDEGDPACLTRPFPRLHPDVLLAPERRLAVPGRGLLE